MRKKVIIATGIAIIILLILFWLTRTHDVAENIEHAETNTTAQVAAIRTPASNSSSVSPSTQPINERQQMQASIDQIRRSEGGEIAMAQSPIIFYGKVIDESNQPISGVHVSYMAQTVNELKQDAFNKGAVTSDGRGMFKIDGINGIGLNLELSHSNYYPYPENSTGFDKRSVPMKGYFSDRDERAELFRMHSKGHPVPLIFRSGGFHAPNNGTIANFPLRGNTRAEILGQLQVQGWTGLHSATYPYDWKVQLTIPNGGIIEATNYFDYVAPETGYSDNTTIEVSGSEGVRKTFFVKLPAGYIRYKLEVIMGKDMFISADYYFNPDGSPNLESSQDMHPTQ